MSTMYKCKDRVSYSRIDTEGKLKVYAIVNAMQDCSLFHSEDVGLSCMDLKSEDAHAWLVNSWDIVIKRRPIMGEVFEVSTWPYKMRGVFGMRNFVMKTEEGETLAYADSHWFFFDQKTGTPVKPEPKIMRLMGWKSRIRWSISQERSKYRKILYIVTVLRCARIIWIPTPI